eukprot:scaffold5215_cov181-Amphora_coffeaeformis.AAC.18
MGPVVGVTRKFTALQECDARNSPIFYFENDLLWIGVHALYIGCNTTFIRNTTIVAHSSTSLAKPGYHAKDNDVHIVTPSVWSASLDLTNLHAPSNTNTTESAPDSTFGSTSCTTTIAYTILGDTKCST